MKNNQDDRQLKRVGIGALFGATVPAGIFFLMIPCENSGSRITGFIHVAWWLVSLPGLLFSGHGFLTATIVIGAWVMLGALISLTMTSRWKPVGAGSPDA